ncbi:GNAT family N-acetyltransferase [Paraherbaspirillum soli]|uniref:GNAT family N-acetyltransferase n=1 Tax=Paraherbaspirillum soli TaxID=631222 RepID=A0ABW0M5Z6_9BURK
MSEAEFDVFAERIIPEYAQEKVAAGDWPIVEADRKSRAEFVKHLPSGLATPGHHFFTITDPGNANVGTLWLSEQDSGGRQTAFIYDLFIEPPQRRQGYARDAMLASEPIARELGLREMSLHAFGHNQAAIALYQSLGFRITDVEMAKKLG